MYFEPNALEELKEFLEANHKDVTDIAYLKIICRNCGNVFFESPTSWDDLKFLDFNYDAGYGMRELNELVAFKDGTWLSRGEYDGSEWWEYNEYPSLDKVRNFSNY